MNVILVFLFFSLLTQAQALTLTQAISKTEWTSTQAFELGDRPTFKKKSNFFDADKSYVLGVFGLEKGESTKPEEKNLASVLAKIRQANEFLKVQGSTFNQLSNVEPHGIFLLLEDFRIAPGSDLYPELRKIFDALLRKKWVLREGVKLSADYKTLTTIKEGKAIESNPFDFPFACSKNRAPAYCLFKDIGILYVEELK
jgi:hypothetical protein